MIGQSRRIGDHLMKSSNIVSEIRFISSFCSAFSTFIQDSDGENHQNLFFYKSMDNEGMHSFSEIRIGLRSSENDLFENFLWETMKKCPKTQHCRCGKFSKIDFCDLGWKNCSDCFQIRFLRHTLDTLSNYSLRSGIG